MLSKFTACWRLLRRLSGDDAYERYLSHIAKHHGSDCDHEMHPPLSKKDFFKQWQNEKWNGVKRCC
jgi:uncharacterized short protein YbdD (DUF466 family)